ncbi:hypothetical protein Ade02nite_18880 [Paractinoplanes deccanensis]|uniref:Uncharacterized protein n=1 Tax=Paractinoplanes deccanensis TaxID=113561 RepID=A0ABQ3XZR8_9ACTN|nr:hypothetical protein [Actinoplanes deccanensis]GID73247.1 hypothetical protein Ade02nite_18880 [Actinoplanes deccanensis]
MNIDDLPDYAIKLADVAPRLTPDQLELISSTLYQPGRAPRRLANEPSAEVHELPARPRRRKQAA